ncbi:MAG TPA: hypothetical protein VM537_08345 [Anaerolineae bacterium]|nr:hypothetical protein [Anaerolineae bacterium]
MARQYLDEGVRALVCTPDLWALPQLSVISLLQQFPSDTPINFTCGNSGPKPGVVFSHAINGGEANAKLMLGGRMQSKCEGVRFNLGASCRHTPRDNRSAGS